jgi:hypothetical protein
MLSWLGQVQDTRDQNRITYLREFLLYMGLMLFLLKVSSRRQVGFELDSLEALKNLNALSGCSQETMAHPGTLDHFLGHVPTESLEKLRWRMMHRLIRMKALEAGRLMGYLLIAIDGTGQYTFRERHCERCLEQKHHDKTLYYHNVLEAKLVTPEGLAFSVGHEFIENADPHATKQDCELKAFGRLAERLKKDFPQLLLCLCLDGLYAKGTVLTVCERNDWKYIITFKEGSLPALWKEYQTLLGLCPQNRKTHRTGDGAQQTFGWVEDLPHTDDQKKTHRFNAFQCQEVRGGQTTFFAWITNFPVGHDTVAALANQGGRCRWKIENEGFNTQKNGGFNLEHAYSLQDRQMRNYYLLMQIAHMILQLLERGSLLSRNCKKLFGSIRNLARRLAESIRNFLIPPEALDPAFAKTIQIRLNTS